MGAVSDVAIVQNETRGLGCKRKAMASQKRLRCWNLKVNLAERFCPLELRVLMSIWKRREWRVEPGLLCDFCYTHLSAGHLFLLQAPDL